MLNYRHLYYFWVVTKEGGFTRAAERLGMAVQTISAQVRELERALGHQLLRPVGRGVALTEAGQVAFARAEDIFRLGQALAEEVRAAASAQTARITLGLSDGISKLAAHALLAPVLDTPNLHLVCHEGEFESLLAELALHRLDVVLAGQPAPRNPSLRLHSERLVDAPVEWYGAAKWVSPARCRRFPRSLDEVPVLLPTGHSALRARLDRWFESEGLKPQIVGEFEDSALLAVFAARGLGVFPVSHLGADQAFPLSGLRLLGRCTEVREDVHAIVSRRGQNHPLVRRLLSLATDVGVTDASEGLGRAGVAPRVRPG